MVPSAMPPPDRDRLEPVPASEAGPVHPPDDAVGAVAAAFEGDGATADDDRQRDEPTLTEAERDEAEDGDARDFEFRSAADWLGDDGLDEEGEIRTRWIPGEGGRSDAWVSGGTLDDLGVESIQVTQCWNSRGKLVYQADSLGYTQDGGDVADCVYTDVGELEHIQGSVHE